MSSDFYADGQGAEKIVYKPSSHQFTDPIRLFKANDPYYWELDNVPLKQIQENVLWLKDQVGEGIDTLGNTRADFIELRPTATGADRTVVVSPGRFMGRVNDAYQTGISTLVLKTAANVEGNTLNEIEITTPVDTLKAFAGATTLGIMADNGLYDTVQHNVTSPLSSPYLGWSNTYSQFIQNNKSSDFVLDLQKNKLALWKQATTVKNYGGDPASRVDLQQLAVEFTRVYGAPFRTALVNIPNPLSIDVPSFNDADYSNSTSYVPSVRVDLLFVYTKPVDASSTTILQPNGQSGTKLTEPVLGLVKGAGVISLNAKPSSSPFAGQTLDSDFFASDTYTTNADNANIYFEGSGAFDSLGNRQTASIIPDLNQTSMGVADTYANFPSPDDLMNAAPYITDGVAKNNLSLIGQSVLPLAYIFVKKNKGVVETSDIFDIRPFFRTAELTYNERAGLAAANPPTSLANPVVSKYELADTTEKLKNFATTVSIPPEYPRPVGTGFIFGGVRQGPEGAIARMDADDSVQVNKFTGNIASLEDITSHLQSVGYLPYISSPYTVPEYPDWEVAPWAAGLNSAGTGYTDRMFFWYQGSTDEAYPYSQDTAFKDAWGSPVLDPVVGFDPGEQGTMQVMIKKRIDLDKTLVPWMTDYDVRATLQNCSLNSINPRIGNTSNNDLGQYKTPQGVYVEKYENYFNVVCTFVTRSPMEEQEQNIHSGEKNGVGGPPSDWRFNRRHFGGNVYVTRDSSRIPQAVANSTIKSGDYPFSKFYGLEGDKAAYMSRNAFCVYPTVKFEIIGYPENYKNNIKVDSGNNPTIVLQTAPE